MSFFKIVYSSDFQLPSHPLICPDSFYNNKILFEEKLTWEMKLSDITPFLVDYNHTIQSVIS